MSEKEKLLQESWLRCYKNNVPKDLKQPLLVAEKQELELSLKKNATLIDIFSKHSENIIKSSNTNNSVIIITDCNGMVLSKYYTNNLSNTGINHLIKQGVYLTEKSCGTNTVSLAMIKKDRVRMSKNDYYCSFFQEWDSLAEPIFMNENAIGYISILISNKDYIRKNFLLLDYLNSKISLNYIKNTLFSREDNQLLNEGECEVLQFTALGYSISEISEKLNISESTVKYRRKILCEKLEASNIVNAIAISITNNLVKISV
ncbi:response regulator transcription factor [Natronospora cellulosivora (SeqCode)]